MTAAPRSNDEGATRLTAASPALSHLDGAHELLDDHAQRDHADDDARTQRRAKPAAQAKVERVGCLADPRSWQQGDRDGGHDHDRQLDPGGDDHERGEDGERPRDRPRAVERGRRIAGHRDGDHSHEQLDPDERCGRARELGAQRERAGEGERDRRHGRAHATDPLEHEPEHQRGGDERQPEVDPDVVADVGVVAPHEEGHDGEERGLRVCARAMDALEGASARPLLQGRQEIDRDGVAAREAEGEQRPQRHDREPRRGQPAPAHSGASPVDHQPEQVDGRHRVDRHEQALHVTHRLTPSAID